MGCRREDAHTVSKAHEGTRKESANTPYGLLVQSHVSHKLEEYCSMGSQELPRARPKHALDTSAH